MKPLKPTLAVLGVLTLAACGSPQATTSHTSQQTPTVLASSAPETSSAATSSPDTHQLVTATSTELGDTSRRIPEDLSNQLTQGGLVIVHRYTGATYPSQTTPAPDGFIDDGQRISNTSIDRMNQLAAQYRDLDIPVSQALSSEYYFVYQHADQAMDVPVEVNRDLTGSLNFSDPKELETSLQGLRNRTVTPPPAGTNTVLFTHQGKFDKAYGFYPDAGWTLIFAPDGTGTPNLIASMSLDDFLALT
ncbi:hypothetical protein [Rothia nasimurium]|uniref:hypothetical protein n=1 Tax=Rothia nasimurium TaxID=85336 RepID=UPI001F42D425|nr:hypothetical protein [Rothia nasimurium]